MRRMRRTEEAGWILLEAAALGMIVLAAAAVVGVFARTALIEEQAAARMGAALLARGQLAVMEADLDGGTPPIAGTTTSEENGVVYGVRTEVARDGAFYDVRMHVSWQLAGRQESAAFVRRMRVHGQTAGAP